MTIHQIKSLPLFDVEESFDSMNEFYFSLYYDDKSYHTKLNLQDGKIKRQDGDQAPLDFAMTGKVYAKHLS
jgi:putative sterol carrier protein